MVKKLPIQSDYVVVHMDEVRKAYLLPYVTANAFFRGFLGFKNTSSRITLGAVKIVYVDEYEQYEGYTQLRYQTSFVSLENFLFLKLNGHINYKLDYNLKKNVYNLPKRYLKILKN